MIPIPLKDAYPELQKMLDDKDKLIQERGTQLEDHANQIKQLGYILQERDKKIAEGVMLLKDVRAEIERCHKFEEQNIDMTQEIIVLKKQNEKIADLRKVIHDVCDNIIGYLTDEFSQDTAMTEIIAITDNSKVVELMKEL